MGGLFLTDWLCGDTGVEYLAGADVWLCGFRLGFRGGLWRDNHFVVHHRSEEISGQLSVERNDCLSVVGGSLVHASAGGRY